MKLLLVGHNIHKILENLSNENICVRSNSCFNSLFLSSESNIMSNNAVVNGNHCGDYHHCLMTDVKIHRWCSLTHHQYFLFCACLSAYANKFNLNFMKFYEGHIQCHEMFHNSFILIYNISFMLPCSYIPNWACSNSFNLNSQFLLLLIPNRQTCWTFF